MASRQPSDLRQRQIADAALAVLAEDGLPRFTSLAIARRIGVSDAALFRHFADKGAIVLAAIDRVEELLFAGHPPADADPLRRLQVFFERRAALVRAHPGVSRVVASDALARVAPPEGVARVAAMRRRSAAFVRACLDEAAAAGALAGADPADAAVVVVGALYALAHLDVGADRSGALPARVWSALERFLRGSPPPSARARGAGARGGRPRRPPRGTR